MNDIERLENRCEDLEKEVAVLREVLGSILMGACPLSHEPRPFTYQSSTCEWCGEERPPDPAYVKKIDDMTRERERLQARKKP